MPISLLPSFLFYCLISGITPGPANLSSMSAALRYGRKTALRQWRGLFVGYCIVALAAVFVCYFLGGVLGSYVTYLAYIGAAYLIFLAVKMVLPAKSSEDAAAEKDCNFFTGLLIQLTNVKIMIFCLTALSSYVLPYTQSFGRILLVGIFLPLIGPSCVLVWLFAGEALRRAFGRYRAQINAILAVSLVLCAISLIRTV